MDTLIKALLVTFIIIVAIIGTPILVALVGFAWPVILFIAAIIFIPIAIGIVVGKNTKD